MSINITGTLVPASSTFGIANASDLVGGSAQYASASTIGAIVAARLAIGQLAYDQATGIQYQLVSLTPAGGFANGTWSPVIIPAGGSWSPGADAVATANITLSGEQTLNGVTTSASRVLVEGQTIASQNGVYTSAAGAWTRTADANTSGGFALGKQVAVLGGTLAGTIYVCNLVPVTLGTDPIGFVANTTGTTFNAASPPAIGNVAPNTGSFLSLLLSGALSWAVGTIPIFGGRAVTFASNADHTASTTEYAGFILNVGSSTSLTATRNLILPLTGTYGVWLVRNNTTGVQSIQVIGTSGTGVTVAAGANAIVWTDGTNFYGVSGGGGGNTLVGTAKSSNFTAAAGNDYKINLTGGAFTGTMPAVTDGALIAFLDTEIAAGTSAFSVTAAGSDKIMNPSSLTLSSAGGTVVALNRNGQSVVYEGIVSATLGNYWFARNN